MQDRIKVNVQQGKLVRHPITGQPIKDGDMVPKSTYFVRKIKDGDLLEVSDTPVVLTKAQAQNREEKVEFSENTKRKGKKHNSDEASG